MDQLGIVKKSISGTRNNLLTSVAHSLYSISLRCCVYFDCLRKQIIIAATFIGNRLIVPMCMSRGCRALSPKRSISARVRVLCVELAVPGVCMLL